MQCAVIAFREVLPTGVYFYRIDATSMTEKGKSFTEVKKMLLLK